MPLLRKSGGGKVLIMPRFLANKATVFIKNSSITQTSNASNFYNAIETDFTQAGFDTATLQPVANTLEQTVVDTGTGKSGVLTAFLSSLASAPNSVMTVRVTMDGKLTTFVGTLKDASSYLMCLGDFSPWLAATGSQNVGDSSLNDGGFMAPQSRNISMNTPLNTLAKGMLVGMVFKDSMKITIQCDNNLVVGSASHKAAALWLTTIPEGLI